MIKPIKFESEILDIKSLTPTVKSFVLSVPDEFSFEPGQFVTIFIKTPMGTIERRSYSIANSVHQKGRIELCIDKVENGRVSPLLHDMHIGTKFNAQGPLGVFILEENAKNKDNIFIATGSGITPFVSMIPYLLQQTDKKVILLDGYKHENEVLYKNVFDSLKKKYKNFEHHTIISRPSENHKGNTGRVQQLIEKHVPSDFSGDFYLCGLFEMIKDVGQLLAKRNVVSKRIIFERYD